MSSHVERSGWEGVGSKQPEVVTSKKERYRGIFDVNIKRQTRQSVLPIVKSSVMKAPCYES